MMEFESNKSIDFKSMFHELDVGIVHQNYEGYIDYANSAAEGFLGLSLDQMQGKHSIDPDWKAIHKDGSDFPGETHPAMVSLKTGEKISDTIMGVYHPIEKKYVWLLVNSVPEFKNNKEKPTGVFASFIEITKQIKAEKHLSYQTELQEMLMRISLNYINIPLDEFDITVNKSLEEIGRFLNADRAYIFDYDFEKKTVSNTYEWCAQGIQPEIDNLQDVPINAIPEWINTHLSGNPLIIRDVLSLDKEDNIRQILEPQQIKSLITVPIFSEGQCLGFLGLDSVDSHFDYSNDEAKLLEVFSNLLANVKKRFVEVKQLDENRQFLSDIIQNSRSLIAIKDLDGRYSLVNEEWSNVSGFSKKETIGKTDYDLLPRNIASNFAQKDNQAIREDRVIQFEQTINSNDVEKHFLSTKFPVKNGNNTITGVCTITTDISELKITQKNLQENKQYLENLVNSQTSYVLRTDLKGFITYSNKKFQKEHEWLYKKRGNDKFKATDFICRHHHKKTEETIGNCIRYPGETFTIELDKPAREGGIQTFLWEFTCLVSSENIPSEIQCIGFDITKRKETEKKLKESEKKYRVIFESTKEAKFISREGKILDCNKSAETLLGTAKENVIGKKILDFSPEVQINGNSSESLHQDYTSSLQKNGYVQFDWILIKADGTEIDTEVNMSPLILEMEQFTLETWRDITEKKQAEKDRIARKEAEASNYAKSRFLSNMSHEIRTPLHAIIGFSQLLEKDSELSKKQDKQINSITRSSRHLLRLVDNVLDYSKIEAGKMEVNPSTFTIQNLSRDLEAIFKLKASQKGIDLSIEIEKDVPKYIYNDEDKIRQVLVNLLGNGVKFTERGAVSLTISASHSENSSKGEMIYFTVKDTGEGISSENLKEIFTEFKQFKTNSAENGTGLGLPISKKLARLLNGDICIESNPGEGTVVNFSIPMSTNNLAGKDSIPNVEEGISSQTLKELNLTVMVIEDNEDIQHTIADMLKNVNIEAALTSSGKEAINNYEDADPDLVLLDLRLPDMDGYTVSDRLKRMSKGKALILAITAGNEDFDKVKELGSGIYDILKKPFSPDDLYTKIVSTVQNIKDSAGPTLKIQSNTSANKPDISSLKSKQTEMIKKAVELGNTLDLEHAAKDIEQNHPEAAQYLLKLTENFEYEKILDWLNER